MKLNIKMQKSKPVLSEVEGLWSCRYAATTSLILTFDI